METVMALLLVCVLAGLAVVPHAALGGKHHRTTSELLRSSGYPSEVHHVTTKDGYILELDRIPRPGRPVVYLANQIYGSAVAYLVLGKGRALGFLLYDAGFDVWLGNFRGTPASCHHIHLNTTDDSFWKFGWQENGELDNPALIDYVLKQSGQQQLVFAGHSMGGTTFFVTAAARPDLLTKISAAFLFAPAVFMTHTEDAHLLALQSIANETLRAADAYKLHNKPTQLLQKLADKMCEGRVLQKAPNFEKMCSAVGPGTPHNFRYDSNYFFPNGASLWQVLHFAQLTDPKWPGFRKFNYGSAEENGVRYGISTPPDFNIKHVKNPVFLYNGYGDTTSTLKDQLLLQATLPNVKRFFYSKNRSFGHNDFVHCPTAATDVWNTVIHDIKKHFAK